LLYGLRTWVSVILVSLVLFPLERYEALHESLKLTALAAIALAFTILYLRKVGAGSAVEGILVGLLWAAVVIALDLVLFAFGAFNMGIGDYLLDVATSYLVFPVVTTLVMSYLRPR
ncbi:MAG: hypothetical protein ACRDSN_25395, partial [Pseudonocardiaceae bacterium]